MLFLLTSFMGTHITIEFKAQQLCNTDAKKIKPVPHWVFPTLILQTSKTSNDI